MSFQAMAWAIKAELPTREKFVLLMLANYASNETGDCYPSMATLAKDTAMSRDSVIRALRSLEASGHIRITRRTSDGVNLPNVYRLEIGSSRQPGVVAGSNHPSRTQQPGVVAGSNTNLSDEPINEPKEPPFVPPQHPPTEPPIKPATRLSADWQPDNDDEAYCLRRGWTPAQVRESADAFRDYWIASAAQTAKKLDWAAAWRTWVRRSEQDRTPQRGRSAPEPAWRQSQRDWVRRVAPGAAHHTTTPEQGVLDVTAIPMD